MKVRNRKAAISFFVFGLYTAVPAASAASFQVGACLHLAAGRGTADSIAPLLNDAQLTFRDDTPWSKIEVQKGSLQFPAKLKELELMVNDSIAHHRKPLLILDYGNEFYDGGSIPQSQQAVDAYVSYASFVVTYFKGRVSQFEVWNEWNGGLGARPATPRSAESYVAVLKPAYKAIKEANPSAEVIGGALSWTDKAWLEAFARANGLSYVDAFSLHPYVQHSRSGPKSPTHLRTSDLLRDELQHVLDKFVPPANAEPFSPMRNTPELAIENLDAFKGRLDSLSGGKSIPIIISEMGWSTMTNPEGVSEAQQAAYVQRFMLLARARPWIQGVWWYDLVDDGNDASNIQHRFGLVRPDLSAKAAYQALQEIMGVLMSGKSVSVSIDSSGVAVATGYDSSGKQVKIAWLATSDTDVKSAWTASSAIGKTFHAAQAGGSSDGYLTFAPLIYTQ